MHFCSTQGGPMIAPSLASFLRHTTALISTCAFPQIQQVMCSTAPTASSMTLTGRFVIGHRMLIVATAIEISNCTTKTTLIFLIQLNFNLVFHVDVKNI